MRLWHIRDPSDYRFALASRVGTWVQRGDPPQSERVKPLVVEWEPSSTLVGDFTVLSLGDLMAQKLVAQELIDYGFKGFGLGPVEMAPNRDHKRPKKNMISLPYKGPELVDVFVTKWVSVNLSHSTLRIVGERDGKPVYEPEGIERIDHGKWDRTTGVLERVRVPRRLGMGIYVNEDDLGSCDIFKLNELGGGVICTDRVRNFILEKKYTNIDFFEVGETM